MIVRRTGAKRGGSPTWYVLADRKEEQAAIREGLIAEEEVWPYRYVLAWGLASKEEAQRALEELRDELRQAVLELSRSEGGVPLQVSTFE